MFDKDSWAKVVDDANRSLTEQAKGRYHALLPLPMRQYVALERSIKQVSTAPHFHWLGWKESKPILVTTPNVGDHSPRFWPCLQAMLGRTPAFCYLPRWEVDEKYGTEGDARNDCCRCAGPDVEAVLFLDSDCLVEYDTLQRLLAHDVKGIVGAWFMSHDGSAPVNVPNQQALQGLQEVEWTGIPCMLIHREVLEAIGDPWFPNGREFGGWQDKIICKRAKAAGFPVYVDTDCVVQLEDRG